MVGGHEVVPGLGPPLGRWEGERLFEGLVA